MSNENVNVAFALGELKAQVAAMNKALDSGFTSIGNKLDDQHDRISSLEETRTENRSERKTVVAMAAFAGGVISLIFSTIISLFKAG